MDGGNGSPDLAQHPPYGWTGWKAMSERDPEFERFLKSHGTGLDLDFQDAQITKAVTKSMLKADWGLEIDLPDDRLCPPVPNRWNYVAWIQSLLDSTSPDYAGRYDPERKAVGLDIGTGASAIYALLSLRSRPNWTMCVTDVDKKNFDSAARNLALNNLLTRTKMYQPIETDPLIPIHALAVDKLDFIICNPPFFSSKKDMHASLRGDGKLKKPKAACTGAEVEMVCPGGELGFVGRMIEESLQLREKVVWYSAMLGSLRSAQLVIDSLKENGISNWATATVKPGKTARWLVAWSFGDMRPRNDIARMAVMENKFYPFPTEYKIALGEDTTAAKSIVDNYLSSLDLDWKWDPETSSGVGQATQNVWKRAYRRAQVKKKEIRAESGFEAFMKSSSGEQDEAAIAFRIRVVEEPANEVIIDWLKGKDVVLWESFSGAIHKHFKVNGC